MPHPFTLVVVVAAALGPLAQAPAPTGGRPADQLARALQDRYDRVRDFSADFVHTYEGGVLRKRATERGTVLIKKPGKMKWSYEAPERKLFVSDGERIYSYIPTDKQVIITRVPGEDTATTPALFLTGKGHLARDFTVSAADVPGASSFSAGSRALKLVPKRREREYDSLTLIVDGETLRIRTLIAVDSQGGRSTLSFSNLKENRGLSDKEFTFKIPRGTDVITDAAPPRSSDRPAR